MDVLLLVLKLLALLVTAVAGGYATFAERPAATPLKRSAKVALYVSAVAFMVGCTIEFLSDQQRRRDADRGLQPIDSLLLRYNGVRLPTQDPLLGAYSARVRKSVEEMAALGHPKWYDWPKDHAHMLMVVRHVLEIQKYTKDSSGKDVFLGTEEQVESWPGVIRIPAASPLFPDKGEEAMVRQLLELNVQVQFYREPIDVSAQSFPEPDLAIFVNAPLEQSFLDVHFEDRSTKMGRIELSALTEETPKHRWRSKGNLLALSDLAGTQMLIRYFDEEPDFRRINRERDPNLLPLSPADYARVRGLMNPGTVTLKVGARSHRIEGSDLKKHVGSDGHAFWEYRFPRSGALFLD